MIFTVYVLYSAKFHKIYIGFSSDIENRLLAHNELETKDYTMRYRPWKIVYTEEFPERSQAAKREKQLKSAKGREFIWSLIG